MEQRRTQQFLKYALGKREEKSENRFGPSEADTFFVQYDTLRLQSYHNLTRPII